MMTRKARAHFDGKVIIPDEPVDLPVGETFEVEIRPVTDETGWDDTTIEDRLRRLAAVTGRIAGPTISAEALRRENLYEERL